MDNLEIINMVKELEIKAYRKDFKMILKETKRILKIAKKLSLSLTICLNDYILALNKQYRGINKETDVLSFALEDNSEKAELEELTNLLGVREIGDIIINFTRVKEQASEYGHSERREFCFLFTHGLLHLLGYDHQDREQERIMFALQEEILNNLGITR